MSTDAKARHSAEDRQGRFVRAIMAEEYSWFSNRLPDCKRHQGGTPSREAERLCPLTPVIHVHFVSARASQAWRFRHRGARDLLPFESVPLVVTVRLLPSQTRQRDH
jgi:hypothetical protein